MDEQPAGQTPPVIVPAVLVDGPATDRDANVEDVSLAAPPNVRTGSPFARRSVASWRDWKAAIARDWNAAMISAWIALIVAIYGWALLSVSSIAALALAIVSVQLGIVGLWSRHRPAAYISILFACVLIAVAGFHTAVDIYTWHYGYDPFAEPETLDSVPPP